MNKLKTIDIKGKEYVTVDTRIRHFRENYNGTGQIETELLSNSNGVCIFKATVLVDGRVVATGHAYEKEGNSYINKTSYIENCETSAIGRALGVFGIGIDTSVASYEEVANAIVQQEQPNFLQECREFARLDQEAYFKIIGNHGYEKASDVTDKKTQNAILKDLRGK